MARRIKKAKIGCIGDFYQHIFIYSRNINPGTYIDPLTVDATEKFTLTTDAYANIKTKNGATVFNDIGDEKLISHEFIIKKPSVTITSENWIEYTGDYYDIVTVEDIKEAGLFLSIRCMLRGKKEKGAAQA